jgi:hypothetical protein
VIFEDYGERSTSKFNTQMNWTRKKSFFKRIFLFQNFVSVDTTQSEIEQATILKSCLMDSHFKDMSS